VSASHHEIELRLVIADPEGLTSRLRAAGARIVGQGLVRTTAYDFPDRRLRAARRTLRVREDWTGTTLTAKTPLTEEADEDAGRVKARHEINLPLAPGLGPDAHLLLQSLGLQETLRYDKRRTSWGLGAAQIDVDVLSDGGDCYAEIEAGAAEIVRVRALLDLDEAPVETRSYFEIVRRAREAQSTVDSR
jgi:predicted adenylyl cyclase CyaB